MARAWTPLRVLVLVGAAVGVLFWIDSIVYWWRIPARSRDGLELIGPIVATAYLIGRVLPALVLGLVGRWLAIAAVLAVLVVALAFRYAVARVAVAALVPTRGYLKSSRRKSMGVPCGVR